MVDFNELAGSPQWSISPGGSTATREGLISWTDRDTFVEEVFPPSFVAGNKEVQGAGIAYPSRPWLRADALEIRPFGERITGPNTTQDFATEITYEYAVARVRYVTPKFPSEDEEEEEDDPVPFLEHRSSVDAEFLTLPSSNLVWDDDSEAASEDVTAGRLVPIIHHEVTWPRVVRPPFSVIRSRIGRVNEETLSFATGDVAPETLLFVGCEWRRQVMSDGTRAWELTYRFSERTVEAEDQAAAGGWNHFYRDSDTKGGFYRLLDTGISSNLDLEIYETKTFTELFQSGS